MDISSSNIVKLNLRNVYIDNKLYLEKRETNCYFQQGLHLVKLFDASQNATNANLYLTPAIIALKKSICIDKYNTDAAYVLKYAVAQNIAVGGSATADAGGCSTSVQDPSGCCAYNL